MSKIDPHWDDVARVVAGHVATELRDNPALLTPWLTPAAAASYIGLAEKSLEAYRHDRTGPKYSKVGLRIVRYHIKDLDAWLRKQAVRQGGAK